MRKLLKQIVEAWENQQIDDDLIGDYIMIPELRDALDDTISYVKKHKPNSYAVGGSDHGNMNPDKKQTQIGMLEYLAAIWSDVKKFTVDDVWFVELTDALDDIVRFVEVKKI